MSLFPTAPVAPATNTRMAKSLEYIPIGRYNSTDAEREKRGRLSAAARRGLILRAALQTFAQAGFGGASVGAIARKAGMTKPVLYDHFASKLVLYRGSRVDTRGTPVAQRRGAVPCGRRCVLPLRL
jgi:Bacterial regulatory proteins, tetR family